MSENKKAKLHQVQGTESGAGKSLLCAALCRIFAAGRSAHRTVQKSKYGAEQLRYP